MSTRKQLKSGLNTKQEQFCRAYVSKELFGNGTQAYMSIYDCKETTARVQASIFLTNPNICERINALLEEAGLTDNNADKQLLFCMNQYADLSIKLQAVREYNRVKGRVTKNYNASVKSFSLLSLFQDDKEIVEN